MKIGFDAKRAFLNSSGLGNYSRNTLNALHQYYPDNHYILFTPEIKKKLFHHYEKFDVISPDSPTSKIFKSLWRSFSVSGYLNKRELDVFHGLSNELPAGIHKTSVPSVVTIHDLIFLRFPEFYKPIDRNIYYRKVKYACAASTKIHAISKQTKADIVNYFHIDPEKIEVVYQSVSPKFFKIQNTGELLKKYELPEKFILSVGTIEHRKNQLAILKAIRSSEIKTTVVFVGTPTIYSAELLKFISENKLENQVKFLSNIPKKDLAGLYQMATLSIYISFFEGFGLPVIESMASGCPVITSNVSCLPETAGDAAILCDPKNIEEIGAALTKLIENKKEREKYIAKGHEWAKHFHPACFSEKMISLYSQVLS
ncbi:glycosyltransferase [Maribellus comscasis]|uniref:Glycosyltransferase n=1 Tax=Maribellus comscasis TaxID=2681766 RepID=A0A6I6JUR0_9BACT|nr:glycosyltransferase family 1 protein [Maribellus comscasis]QGY43892.1 glycosyltransferase [Maribellus comscasis]